MFKWRKRPKSAAEKANEAEIEKLAEEATWGELDNEREAIAEHPFTKRGFFDSPGTAMPDDKPYDGPETDGG